MSVGFRLYFFLGLVMRLLHEWQQHHVFLGGDAINAFP